MFDIICTYTTGCGSLATVLQKMLQILAGYMIVLFGYERYKGDSLKILKQSLYTRNILTTAMVEERIYYCKELQLKYSLNDMKLL